MYKTAFLQQRAGTCQSARDQAPPSMENDDMTVQFAAG